MSLKMPKWLLLVTTALAFACGLRIWYLFARPVPVHQFVEASGGWIDDVDERIQAFVQELDTESLDQSLSRLERVSPYYSPGPGGPDSRWGVRVPLPPNGGTRTVDLVLSNRRVARALVQLLALPRSQASLLLKKELTSTIPAYERAYKAHFDVAQTSTAKFANGTRVRVAPALQISDSADKGPTLAGLRLKVLSLILLAAQCRCDDVEMQRHVVEAVRLAERQYRDACSMPPDANGAAYHLVEDASLYNRQILGSALLACSPFFFDDEAIDAQTIAVPVAAFDARSTRYDWHGRRGFVRPREAESELFVRIARSMTDEQFHALTKGKVKP